MKPFHRSALARIGTVALVVAGGLAAVAAPAHAAAKPEINVIPISTELAKGVKAATAKPFKFTVTNSGNAAAKSVVFRVNTGSLNAKRVGFVVPDGCRIFSAWLYECRLPDLPPGASEDFGVPLFSTGGRGDGGVMYVGAYSRDPEGQDDGEVLTVPVRVSKPGYDLTSWVQDVQANVVVNGAVQDEPDLKPVPRGETVPLDWAVYNGGSRKATGISYGLTVPAGVSFVQKPEGCIEQEIVGKAQLLCDDPGVILKPGEYYTADVRVKVGEDVTEPVLKEGDLFAISLDAAEGPAAEQPRVATAQQRKAFTEVDILDNHTTFEAFVELSAQPTPTPTPTVTPTGEPTATPTPSSSATTTPAPGGGGGGDGGLPVTGVQVSLIGGIGGAILLAGGALLLMSRRRRVVLVAPGDEKPTD
ncbi:LPXTG cell wall anchor domain-containing protein [Micromonospora avicenniae]|uniref:LPXTG-motif cell wall anchor domain-containing protein n=1 Tax=Micromonospora avicenniae TaxID=1198245 RepID=A0A1N6UMU6_9ACTN|nr:LPXTG cell wall anchor domain-containing protein [Micromonospora avicenniae]SIQ66877.1 LPXTG-motif cell wall anchor domain-containing protein [Micromonospora avicenniae]